MRQRTRRRTLSRVRRLNSSVTGDAMGARDTTSCAHQARPGAGRRREGGHADALVSAAGWGLHPLPATLVKEHNRAGGVSRPPFLCRLICLTCLANRMCASILVNLAIWLTLQRSWQKRIMPGVAQQLR